MFDEPAWLINSVLRSKYKPSPATIVEQFRWFLQSHLVVHPTGTFKKWVRTWNMEPTYDSWGKRPRKRGFTELKMLSHHKRDWCMYPPSVGSLHNAFIFMMIPLA